MQPTECRPLGRRRTRRLVAGGVAALLGVALAFAVTPPAKADSNSDEAMFFADLNLVRAKNGVPPLATDGQLINVARAWSAQMAGPAGLSHNPNLASQVSNWRLLGENVGTGGNEPSVEAALEASPHHFANMVDPNYQYVGIGVVETNGVLWVTEDFKQAKSGTLPSTAVPQPAPKPPPRPPSPVPSAAPVHHLSSPPSTHSATPPAAASAAGADAGAPSANATLASATPAPSSSPPSAAGPAKSLARRLPTGLAVVAAGPFLDGTRWASLVLFAVLAGAAVLLSRGRLPSLTHPQVS